MLTSAGKWWLTPPESVEAVDSCFKCVLLLLQVLGQSGNEAGERLRVFLFDDRLAQTA